MGKGLAKVSLSHQQEIYMIDPTRSPTSNQVEEKLTSQASAEAQNKNNSQKTGLADDPSLIANQLDGLQIVVQPQPVSQESEYRYKIYKYTDLKKLPRKKWLVQGLFGPRDICMFFGPPGRGKTSVILNMMVDINLGRQVANAFEVERPLKVLYCAGEGGDSIGERIDAAANHIGEIDLPNISVISSVPQLYSGYDKKTFLTQSTTEFIQSIVEQDGVPDVLIIDTLHSAAVGAKENDSTDIGIVLHNLKFIAKNLGCTILLIHHTTKDGENFRGSSALEGDVDLIVKVDKTSDCGNSYIMKCSKIKDGKNWGSKSFNLIETETSICVDWVDGDTLIQDEHLGESIFTTMSREPNKHFSSDEMASILGKKSNNVRNALNRLVKYKKCKQHKGKVNTYSIL